MKLNKSAIYMALLALGSSAALPSIAADNLAALEVKQVGVVSYVSGGVGDDERQQMDRLAADYQLKMVFAGKGSPNEYLSGVKVQITDKDGKTVLDTVTQGPFLLAKMPAGRYAISAESEGMVKQQTVQVTGAKSQQVVFIW